MERAANQQQLSDGYRALFGDLPASKFLKSFPFLGRPLSCKLKDLAFATTCLSVCLSVTDALWLTGKSYT